MSWTQRRAAFAAALLGLAAYAAPLLSQEPPLPPPGQPGVGPTVPPPLTKAPPVMAQPVVKPGEPTRAAVPVVVPKSDPELGDMRARGAAPTGVQVTATSPFAVTVEWVLPSCASGTSISVGTPGGKSRSFYQSDTLPPSRLCGMGSKMSKTLRVPGDAAPAETPTSAISSQSLEPLQPATAYVFKVAAFYRDSASGGAEPVTLTMPVPPPFTIAAVNPSANVVDISWNPAVRPTKYNVFRDNTWLADVGLSPSYQDKTVKPMTSYVYRIDAVYDPVYTGQSYGAIPPVVISATATTKTPYPVISGFADTHTHPFANLASGGRMFWGSAFGPIDSALAVCDPAHGPGGIGDIIGNIESEFRLNHKTGGAPNFDGWPNYKTKDHQQMYSDWIYRAYQGGLRLIVSLGVNNATICSIANKDTGRTCDDMEAAVLQIEAAKKMEAYIDAQSGGPGRGWFRIAYSPEQARKIIYEGGLAVVLGVEVDKLFGCGKDQCNASNVDVDLNTLYARGVRHVFPVHLADNAFGGYALSGGWLDQALFKLNSKVANGDIAKEVQEEDCSAGGYGQACNQRGLTPLGAHLIRSMMQKGMIIDIDHMSKHTTDTVLAITAASHYPVIGGHTGFVTTSVGAKKSERDKSESQMMAIRQDGGMVSVGANGGAALSYTPSWRGAVPNTCDGSSRTFAQGYLYAVDKMGGPSVAAVGLATDQFLNDMEGPRFDGHCAGEGNNTRVSYPITTRTGLQLGRSQIGNRAPFDYNTDGLAHYGLLPDFIQDLKNDGLTDQDLDPLFRSAEGYIRLWERAIASVPVP